MRTHEFAYVDPTSDPRVLLQQLVEVRKLLYEVETEAPLLIPEGVPLQNGRRTTHWPLREIQRYCRSLMEGVPTLRASPSARRDLESFVTKLVKYPIGMGLFENYTAITRTGSSVVERLTAERTRLIALARRIPNSVEKAENTVRAILGTDTGYEKNHVLATACPSLMPSTLPSRIVQAWRYWVRLHRQRNRDTFAASDIFWTSRRFEDAVDGLSYYRFYETFKPRGFEKTFRDVENMFAQTLLEGFEGKAPSEGEFRAGQFIIGTVHALELVSRSPLLSARLADVVQLALKQLHGYQREDGLWSVRTEERWLPDVWLTARAVLVTLRLSGARELLHRLRRALKWLIRQQATDGSWSARAPSVVTTTACLEACIRSGMGPADNAIRRGVAWVLSKQEEDGLWSDQLAGNRHQVSAIVLEFFSRQGRLPRKLGEFHLLARDFLNKATGLAHETDQHSAGIATILAFQGVEMFLYSVLQANGIMIKKADGKHTVGLESAWGQLNKLLHNRNLHRSTDNRTRRNIVLGDLPASRDGVVHEGTLPRPNKAMMLVDAAKDFVSLYSERMLRFDLML
jgi:hypothetical protein